MDLENPKPEFELFCSRESIRSDVSESDRAVRTAEKLIDYVKRDDVRNVRRILARYGSVLGGEYCSTPGEYSDYTR